MKVLFIHHVGDLYGSSRSLLRLASHLARDGHQVAVALQEQGPLQGALEQQGIQVRPMPELPALHRNRIGSPVALLRLARSIRRAEVELAALLRELRPDLVHSNSATLWPVAGRVAGPLGIPHVQHIRESFFDFGALWKLYRRPLVERSQRIICISSFLAGMFTAEQQRRLVRVIHNGLPREEFDRLDRREVDQFMARFALRRPLVALVGRIKIRRKGQDVLLKAAARLQAKHPGACYVLVGSPFPGNDSHLEQLKHMVHDLGLENSVVFTGHLPDTRVALAACDISVMASSTPEPLGNVTIESMALGKPVVGTDCGGTAELLRDHDTGLLVPPDDPAAMAKALDELLSSPVERQEMGTRAWTHFLQHLEFEPFYRKVLEVYREAIGKPA